MTAETLRLLPPDADQVKLAKEVNAKLGGDSKVNFYRVLKPEGGIDHGVVFQYGSARKNIQESAPFFDVDEMVADVQKWVKRL